MTDSTPALYFDHNATTSVDPRVREAMLPWLGGGHGNPSAPHRFGRPARRAIDEAREQVAALIGGSPSEIVFTSSGTEALNAVIYSAAGLYDPARPHSRGHLVISELEHPAVRQAAARVEAVGMDVSELPPEADGVVSMEYLRYAMRPDTRLVALMLANNELGTLQPVTQAVTICGHYGVPVLCDAVQAIGKIPVSVKKLGVDYLALGGHKFYAPLGSAALWIRDGAEFEPLLVGAPHESGRRASTENLPAIVGLGRAAELARGELDERRQKMSELRDRFERGLDAIPGTVVHCRESPRLPNTSYVGFDRVSGHELMLRLDHAGFAVATGSACTSGRPQPSAVLLAMGVPEAEALESLRVSFGITNTADEVDALLAALASEVEALRASEAAARGR